MRIRIKAPAGLSSSGIYGADGKELAIGTELDVEKEPTDLVGRYEVVSGSTEGKEPVLNSAYAVESKGGGYSVITKDGEPVTKGLRKDDLEGFDTLSEEDRAAFVELHKKDA
ncbi:hypothetical protein [Rhizobium ruizarguesonis]|uniref:hypothetical protein n=1 Tax=Rhizobium ruizarguesonis TaxID=2081791 RepID=UPI000411C9B5|nr:hypothetical protein [Rhizobium ruizarguesonis]QJS27462.1 hypothetical protein RLTA1_09265 [Rhizobium leguminosarum bv. trifolii TA1]UFW96216.1 hypothetical protein RlegTA1_09230 [Rhizobium ruizarguesonis]